jgi:Autographiviridae endonuclease
MNVRRRGPGKPILERLEQRKVVDGQCWRYRGVHDRAGYAFVTYKRVTERVHRVSAHLFLGYDLNSVSDVLHKVICRFKDCWNPEHLYIGTDADNVKDMRKANVYNPYGRLHGRRPH